LFDIDNSGSVDIDEFQKILQANTGVKLSSMKETPSSSSSSDLVSKIFGSSTSISSAQFIEYFLSLQKEIKSVQICQFLLYLRTANAFPVFTLPSIRNGMGQSLWASLACCFYLMPIL